MNGTRRRGRESETQARRRRKRKGGQHETRARRRMKRKGGESKNPSAEEEEEERDPEEEGKKRSEKRNSLRRGGAEMKQNSVTTRGASGTVFNAPTVGNQELCAEGLNESAIAYQGDLMSVSQVR